MKRSYPNQVQKRQLIEANRGVIEELRHNKTQLNTKALVPRGDPGPMEPSLSKKMVGRMLILW